ncbi:MAG: DUF1638 domain-containing protein [Bacteroidetes bacterium]|nr:DUF1638 domain-containing protein [Bacteroidota bacterium]MBU1114665.1 DUF1638 domain-containing protein [Bacteroidota bacterium]MBU1798979.1 DUF1638 domain-containing protein [Bacteroidota bacterium]
MAVLGIITCEILTQEFAFILGTDSGIGRISIIENSNSTRLIQLLELKYSKQIQCIPHLNSYRKEPSDNLEVVVVVLELELHRNKKILRKAILETSRNLAHYVDAFLLGYGLCGNALNNPEELIKAKVPVFIPMDGEHPVDDCVGLIIGGRSCYYAEQCKEPGTFFMIPGWTYNWRKILNKNLPGESIKAAKSMFKRYKRALLITNPTMPPEEMEYNIEEFIKLTGLNTEIRQGTIDILLRTWNSVKEYFMIKSDIIDASEK